MDESRMKKVLDASPDMYLIIDGDGILIDFKPSRFFDQALPPGEFLGKTLGEVLPGKLAEIGLLRTREVLETGKECLLEYSLLIDGTPNYYEARFTLFDEKQVLVIIRDVSDQKRSMQAAQALMDASEDIFLLLDRQGYIMSLNQSAANFYEKTPEQMEGTLYWDHISPEKARIRKQRLEEIFLSGELTKFVDMSGERIFEVSCNPVPELSGDLRYVAYFIKDITDQVKAEQELIETDARHRSLFEENPVPMYIYDTKSLMITDANTAMIDNYGYTRDELISMTIGDIRPSEDVSKVMENVTDLRSKKVYLGLWRHIKKDGSVIDVEITSGDFPYENRPARLVLCNDVTEKVQIQRALEDRESQYRHLFEQNPLPMMIIDPVSMKLLNVNQAAVIHYGYEKDEFLSLTIENLRPPEDVEEALVAIRSLRSPAEKMGVFRHLKKDGALILVDVISHEINYEGQKARLALCNDVTDQIQARKALKKSEEKFRSIVESSPMGIHIYQLNDDDRLIFSGANSAADKILGVDHDRYLGLTIEEAFPGSTGTEISNRYREVCLSGNPWHTEQINYQDDQINGAFEVYAFQTGQRSMSALFLDITERKKAQEAIAESEEKFRKAFLTSPDPMTISRLEDGVLLEVNEGFVNTTGYSQDDCLGKSSIDLDIWVEDKQRDDLASELKERGKVENMEVNIRTREGTIKSALVSAAIIKISNVPRMFTISRDITELKKAEEALIKSEEQLRASLGEKEILLKEIHHRVKNNLQVISGLLDLQAHHIGDPAGREIYKESQNRVITMALIHEELYKSVNLSQVDFAEYIQNLCENLMISYGVDRKRIKLDISVEKTEMVVDTAIPCGLIINELITNTLKHAFPDKRKGTISLSFKQLKNKNYLLTMSDDGIGMPRKVDINKTTTLGMQLITVLVGQLGGTLKVKRGEGTSFTIKFKEYHEAGSVLY
jgi:PAS domain S-box-containing protein